MCDLKVLLTIIQQGDIEKLKCELNQIEIKNSLLTSYAILFKQREILHYLVEEKKVPINFMKKHLFIVNENDFDFILFLSKFGIKLHKKVYYIMVIKNYHQLFQQVMENDLIILANNDLLTDSEDFISNLFQFAVKNDDLIILNYLYERFSTTDFFGKKRCKYLTSEIYGEVKLIDTLNWLKAMNCPINKDCSIIFTFMNKLQHLQWLEENHFPIDYKKCFEIALENHYYKIIDYLIDKTNKINIQDSIQIILVDLQKKNVNINEIIKILTLLLKKIDYNDILISNIIKYAANTNLEQIYDFVIKEFNGLINYEKIFHKYSIENKFQINNEKIIQSISCFPGFQNQMVWKFLGKNLTIDYLNYLNTHFGPPTINFYLYDRSLFSSDVLKWFFNQFKYFNEALIIYNIICITDTNERNNLIQWFKENVSFEYKYKIEFHDILTYLVKQNNADEIFLEISFLFEEPNKLNIKQLYENEYTFAYEYILHKCFKNNLVNILLKIIDTIANLPASEILEDIIQSGNLHSVTLVYQKLVLQGYTFTSFDRNHFEDIAQLNGFLDIYQWLIEEIKL